VGDPTDVQFNPESLKIQLSNRVEGGRSAGRQVRQFVGASSSTFSLDLEFDTADEGTTDAPVSVLERTQVLEKFIQPKTEGDNAREQPAKLRFHWGNLIIDGVVESMDLDFDHFAHNGYPLHAKVTLKMKEQKIEFQFAASGNGGGSGGGGDGGQRAAQALDGETPSQAAARLGLDPAGWRGLGLDLSLGLSLEAGLELNFDAEFSASFGVDIQAGISAGIDVDLSTSLGLSAGASVNVAPHLANDPRPVDQLSSGLALSRAGGVNAASEELARVQSDNAAQTALTAFSPATNGAGSAGSATSAATGARTTNTGSGQRSPGSAKRPSARPRPDPRALSFGFGVPLQTRRVPVLDQQQEIRASGSSPAGAVSGHWDSAGKKLADKVQARRRPNKRCGCVTRCQH
jgi:hypothetical protein